MIPFNFNIEQQFTFNFFELIEFIVGRRLLSILLLSN